MSAGPRLEASAAVGVTGLAVFQLASMWQSAAPSLGDIRKAPAGDWEARQTLTDADVLVGTTALLAGGTASWLMRSWVPFLVMAAAFSCMSLWYHSVANGGNAPLNF